MTQDQLKELKHRLELEMFMDLGGNKGVYFDKIINEIFGVDGMPKPEPEEPPQVVPIPSYEDPKPVAAAPEGEKKEPPKPPPPGTKQVADATGLKTVKMDPIEEVPEGEAKPPAPEHQTAPPPGQPVDPFASPHQVY